MPATKEIVASTLIGAAVVIGILALMRSRAQAKTAADEVEARRLLAERKAEAATAARELELKRQKEESAAREAQALKDSAVTKKEELQKKQAAADKAAAAEKAEAERASAAEKAASLKSAFRPHAPVQISFGSQTGNAKAIAQELYETLTEQGVSCNLSDLNAWKQWSPALEKTEFGIFVMSTTGNGDPCDNMDKFHRFLKRKSHVEGRELGLMRHLSFSVLALGDTNYDKFCEMGRWMDERLKVLGATPFLPVAMADEATGLEDVVEPWVEAVQKALFSNLSADGDGATGKGEREETKQDTSPAAPTAPSPSSASAGVVAAAATEASAPSSFDESAGLNKEILQLQTVS
mmetsp:Transcript_19650/g.38957  ORF Transcript_19650/g.38957 Transcript_19650/m.38957 type:complete len:350 (-) Transcript_19650:340-1389(-)